jgi:hypothetical protein
LPAKGQSNPQASWKADQASDLQAQGIWMVEDLRELGAVSGHLTQFREQAQRIKAFFRKHFEEGTPAMVIGVAQLPESMRFANDLMKAHMLFGAISVSNEADHEELRNREIYTVYYFSRRSQPTRGEKRMNDLKNCPFCGKRPSFRRHIIEYEAGQEGQAGEYDEGFSISCNKCGFEIAKEYRDDVIRTWNNRPASDR